MTERHDRSPAVRRAGPPDAAAGVRIRAPLVDDRLVARSGLAAVRAAEPDILVVGEVAGGGAAAAARLAPDPVVMDVSIGGAGAEAATRRIAGRAGAPVHAAGARGRAPAVLVLTVHDEEEYVRPMLAAEAAGSLVKRTAARDLVRAVRAVARGETYVRPEGGHVRARERNRWAEAGAGAGPVPPAARPAGAAAGNVSAPAASNPHGVVFGATPVRRWLGA